MQTSLGFVTKAAGDAFAKGDYGTLEAAPRTLKAFLGWAPLKMVFAKHVPEALIKLLGDDRVRKGAADALRVLVKRPFDQVSDAQDPKDNLAMAALDEFAFRDVMFSGLMLALLKLRLPASGKVLLVDACISAILASGILPGQAHALGPNAYCGRHPCKSQLYWLYGECRKIIYYSIIGVLA